MSEGIAELQPRAAAGHFASPYANRAELIEEICERLADGEPLRAICRDPRMPSWRHAYEWIAGQDDTGEAMARAREAGHDSIAADTLSIADDRTGDPQRDKLRIETRLKLLSKWNPKKYGESTQLRHADADGAKLDTAPLVGELLSLMQPGMTITEVAPAPKAAAYRDVTPQKDAARPAYRPRGARPADVDDLV